MRMADRVARFNRRVANPIQMLWAGWAPTYGIVEHRGRTSGTAYRNPVTVFDAQVDGAPAVAIALPYGPDRDWVKNLLAAGGGRLRSRGHTFAVTAPQVLPKSQAATYVTGRLGMFRRVPADYAILLQTAS